ncbi:MAG: hypothetical protein GC204_02305, partial [Chloroflexi bacterium]|nr:hypothetical protein [Chloroflexota bacterium]
MSDQQDTYILSFNSDFADPNVIASSKTFPSNVRPETMFVSSDGRWLFATGVPNGVNYFPLAYTRVGQPFAKPQLYDYQAVLSADNSWLFYNSIDASGLRESYDFLDLESGRLIELIGAPLANPGSMLGMQEYIVPASGWMPSDQSLTYIHYGGAFADGLYQIDLTDIDFTKSGQYPMPQATKLLSFDRDTGGASFSPSRKYILYVQARDQGQDVGYTDARTINILNLETGSILTIPTGDGEIARRVQWRAD